MTRHRDNRLSDAPMVSLACRRCGAHVLARKSSWDQTSVQWDAAALNACQERCEAARLRGLFLSCSALRDSIADAVQQGVLPIVDEATAGTLARQ